MRGSMHQMLRRPPALQPGDTIRLIAPSGAFDQERFEAGAALIRAAGWNLEYDWRLFSKHGYLAGSDALRWEVLREALEASQAKALWVVRGGYGVTRLLPRLRAGMLQRANKLLIGFSDATALHAQWVRDGVCSVHGPNVTTLAQWTNQAREELWRWLRAPEPIAYSATLAAGAKQAAAGPLVGGNLTVLGALVGTGRLPPTRGAWLLLEDVGEQPYRLDRTLTQLLQADAFAGVAGFLIGQLTRCGGDSAEAEREARKVVVDTLAATGRPVLVGLPFGHDASSRAVMLGAEVQWQPGTSRLTVHPPAPQAA